MPCRIPVARAEVMAAHIARTLKIDRGVPSAGWLPCGNWASTARILRTLPCYNNRDTCSQNNLIFRCTGMKCPFCGFVNDKVVDSRESKEAESIRRRRECLQCGKRYTTYERIDEIPYMVVKKDGRREKFDRQKVLNGLLRACEKRPVPISKLEHIVNDAESFVIDSPERERRTTEIGELIMNELRKLDKVAYVRFASVYLDFKDAGEFLSELQDLLKSKEPQAKAKPGPKVQ